jgi:HSP20 family protein
MITRNSVTPFERLYALQRELDRAFNGTETMESGSFVPPMDVVETNDEVLVHLEVPGISRRDLEIRTEGNVVIVTGEKKYVETENRKEGGFSSVERRYGRFERSFALPRTVSTTDIRARYADGVLTIVLPKIEESKPRRIEIEDGSESGKQLS